MNRRFFNNPLFSDVKLIIDGKSYHAHKVILASRADYFDTLFSSNFEEGKSSEITVEDPRFLQILYYIYDFELDEKNVPIEYLLDTADYMMIHNLKSECMMKLTKPYPGDYEQLRLLMVYDKEGFFSDQDNSYYIINVLGCITRENIEDIVNAAKDTKELHQNILYTIFRTPLDYPGGLLYINKFIELENELPWPLVREIALIDMVIEAQNIKKIVAIMKLRDDDNIDYSLFRYVTYGYGTMKHCKGELNAFMILKCIKHLKIHGADMLEVAHDKEKEYYIDKCTELLEYYYENRSDA